MVSINCHRHNLICLTLLLFAVISCFSSASAAVNKELANQQPHRIKAEILNSSSIRLRWRRPKAEIVCPTRRYMIRLKERSRSTTPSDRRTASKARVWTVNGSHTSAVIVHDLQPNSAYMVRILAENCESKWKSSKWLGVETTRMGDDRKLLDRSPKDADRTYSTDIVDEVLDKRSHQPPGQPNQVRTNALKNSVSVSWEPPPSDTGSLVRGYMIGYGEGVPDVNWRYVEGRQRNVTIDNLKKSTQYVISVSAFNDFGKSVPVYDFVYTKDSAASSEANFSSPLVTPTDLRVKSLSPSSIQVNWTDSSLGVRRGESSDGRYYNLHYRVTPDGKTSSILVNDLSVALDDLQPSGRYEFKVRAVRGEEMTEFSEPVVVRTSEDEESEEMEEEEEEEEEDEDGKMEDGKILDRFPDNDTEKRINGVREERLQRNPSNPAKRRIQPRRDSVYSVQFRSVVYHRITAFVTWPQFPEQSTSACDPGSGGGVRPKVVGYRLRYQRLSDTGKPDQKSSATKELMENFFLIEDLLPESKYRYQIQYLLDGNTTSSIGWSDEAIVDTHHTGRL